MTDLVERLQEWSRILRVADIAPDPGDTRVPDLLDEAKTEITCLRGEVERLRGDWSRALIEAAEYAEFYAEERLRLCGDAVLHDPVFSAKHGATITRTDIAKSRDLQVDGTINSAGFHAASDIAGHLRKLAETAG